jgi:hypothetical protein
MLILRWRSRGFKVTAATLWLTTSLRGDSISLAVFDCLPVQPPHWQWPSSRDR